mgnify:CR=1 FL=1
MSELTPRQAEILDLIRASIAERGSPPTRAEIAEAFGKDSPRYGSGAPDLWRWDPDKAKRIG